MLKLSVRFWLMLLGGMCTMAMGVVGWGLTTKPQFLTLGIIATLAVLLLGSFYKRSSSTIVDDFKASIRHLEKVARTNAAWHWEQNRKSDDAVIAAEHRGQHKAYWRVALRLSDLEVMKEVER
jgi:hypothetical protein